MTLFDKEHYELMEAFERQFAHMRLDKEPKEIWPQGNIYQNGETNSLFIAFRFGYAYGKAID